jgi:hypothetical protein
MINFIFRTDRRTKNGSQRADRKYVYMPNLEKKKKEKKKKKKKIQIL